MTVRAAAVVPTFNEARTIALVVAGVSPFVERVIVVDDGSTDDTAAAARAAGAVVIAHGENQGKGYAVRSGLTQVLASSDLTHVLTIDGDMQHLPHESERLLQAAGATGADLVLGSRPFERAEMPASRYHANRLGSLALSWFLGSHQRDTQCGFRVFRLDMLRALRLSASGYEIETEMLVKVGRMGGRIVSVPVTAVYAGGVSKLRPVRDTTRTCFLAVYYRYLEPL